MKPPVLGVAFLCLASCGAPRGVARAEIPPPYLPAAEARPAQAPVLDNEEATQDFLQLQIDRSIEVKPPADPEIRIVERIILGGEQDRPGRYRHPHRRSSFPLRTAFGAGIGAIIGHQSGHRGRGAAIGAGVGLLLDLVSH